MICAARNEAAGFRAESWAESRQRREDGTDDRCLLYKLASLRGKDGGRSFARRSRVRRRCGTWVPQRGVCSRRCGSNEGRGPLPFENASS